MLETNALRFNEPLTWRYGRPIAVSDLLARLQRLADELASIEQADADRESLVPKAQELADAQVLAHRDKGVKAWTMLCIVEMFRLLAPDAPYKGGQLKQIFDNFMSTMVPSLASPTDPYSQQYLAILTSLTTIKSIALLTDIPGSDHLIFTLFNNCFDVMSGTMRSGDGEQLPKNVEYHMTNMLCTLVDECETLPQGVVDTILAQFLRADPNALSMGKKGEAQSSMMLREVSPAYNMARSICNTCADKMSRAIGQYFSSVLIDASETTAIAKSSRARGKKRTHDESEDESDDGLLTPPAEGDLEEVEKAHRLLRELWRSSPDVVQNIVPQMEAEIAAENVQLRTMAIQTVGDMVSGIGAAGPPVPVPMDPAAYPSQSLDSAAASTQYQNVLLAPAAPHAFSSVYPTAYQSFVDRHRDKSAQVRCVWATAVGRIISTSGGGKGLDAEQETRLLRHFSDMLLDQDERVRLAAVQAVAQFDFDGIVQHLGTAGGLNTPGSPLCNLADRIKDKKHAVRSEAMELLARIWGVAAGAIEEGSERIRDMLASIPSRILMAIYLNNIETSALVQRVLYESLLPISYPPLKKPAASDSERARDSQTIAEKEADPDRIRARRILVLFRDLDDKEQKDRKVFINLQQRQKGNAKYVEAYLKACTEYNGGAESEGKAREATQKRLDTLIGAMSRTTPDPVVAVEHLKRFAKHHDRRSYQLLRFCYAPESDYRKIVKAIRELTKRMEDAPTDVKATLLTILPLVYSTSILVYNRSHVPTIMDIARTDEKGLGSAAHEVLKQISTEAPEVFRVHVHELCEELKKQAPSASSPNDSTAVDTLKACAGFAQRFPDDMPKDRDFYKAMAAFAKYGTPPEAAKHAVTVIVSSAEKKEMYIKDVLKYCLKDFRFGTENFLSRLAAISQLRLVAREGTEDQTDAIMALAVGDILGEIRTTAGSGDREWSDDFDDDLCAKLWALKILVNGLRGMGTSTELQESRSTVAPIADNVYRLLNTLIKEDGELCKDKTAPTPRHHRSHLRLAAAKQLLKLSCNRALDQYLTPSDFNRLGQIAQDPLPEVRSGFLKTLKKYLGQGKLPNRFYALAFLYAFEPVKATMENAVTWLKARAAMSAKLKDTSMETIFARFLSLLAHHQDFSRGIDDLEDFVEYIMFYLKNVATEANLPVIYHIAQRLKSVQDGIDPGKSDDLYTMSDLAEAVIRQFQEQHHWSLQLYSSKVRLPTGIFAQLPSHALAQEIAEKRYIPEELADKLEDLVKGSLKSKKRKAEGSSSHAAKKVKGNVNGETKKLAVRKPSRPATTPKKKAAETVTHSERRKSARASKAQNYAENEDSDDDDEMEHWNEEIAEPDAESVDSSTPPTSDPAPAPVPVSTKKARKKPASRRPAAKAVPARSARATAGANQVEKDVMDIPDDSDEELSDVPDDLDG